MIGVEQTSWPDAFAIAVEIVAFCALFGWILWLISDKRHGR